MVLRVDVVDAALSAAYGDGRDAGPDRPARARPAASSTTRSPRELAAEPQLALLCGRYEGVDERVREHLADDAVSVGPYVLSGGELAAMVVADAVLRKLPGALGHAESAVEESFSEALGGAPEYPHYTRPAVLPRLGGARGAALRRPRAGAASGGWSRAAAGRRRPGALRARSLICPRPARPSLARVRVGPRLVSGPSGRQMPGAALTESP